MLRLLCIGGACLALAVGAGCGDDEEEPAAGGSADTAAQEAPPATTETESAETETEASESEGSGDDTIVVTMKDFAFDPQEVEATVGQTVEWRNEDDAPHNAVAQGGTSDLETETFGRGESDTYTLDEAGSIEYICTVHPQMTGTITVSE